MATISNTPRPGYVWDSTDNVWYPIGVGGHSHSEIAKTIADAKGDLIVGTAADTVDRLAVGNNGETLVADSSTSTGLRYQANFAAGKNKIINGDFGVWQRGTSFTLTNSVDNIYTADRFIDFYIGTGTTTVSQQTFTPGTAPVAGYEGSYFKRAALSSGTTYYATQQKIEDVRTFAGQTVTISFWAKATSSIGFLIYWRQNFGTGGSALADTTTSVTVSSSSWTRYSATISVPSISGKTIGTGSMVQLLFAQSGGTVASKTVDVGGWQVEAGSVATAFQTATGTIQGELAACQRYFQKSFQLSTAPANNSSDTLGPVTFGRQATSGAVEPQMWIKWKTQMRSAPSVTLYNIYSGTAGQWSDGSTTGANARCFNISDSAAIIDNTDVTLTLANAVIHYAANSEL